MRVLKPASDTVFIKMSLSILLDGFWREMGRARCMVGETVLVRGDEGAASPGGRGCENEEMLETRSMSMRTWPLITLGSGVLEKG